MTAGQVAVWCAVRWRWGRDKTQVTLQAGDGRR